MKTRKLLFIPLLCLGFGVAVVSLPKTASIVKAEETVEIVPEESEQSTVDEFKTEVTKFKETVVNPIIIFLGSLNLASIATVIFGVVIRYISNKKRDKKFDENNETLDKLIIEQKTLIEESKEAKERAVDSFVAASKIVYEALDLVKGIKKDCEKISELKLAVIAMAEALIAESKANPEVVKSGAIKQITEIQKRVAELGK